MRWERLFINFFIAHVESTMSTPPRKTTKATNDISHHAFTIKKKRENALENHNRKTQNNINRQRIRPLSGARVKILEDIKKILAPLRMSQEETELEAYRILDVFEREPKNVENEREYEVSEYRTAVLFNSSGDVVSRVANKLKEYHEKLYKKILEKYMSKRQSAGRRKTRKNRRVAL
jgi:hypothetical protein